MFSIPTRNCLRPHRRAFLFGALIVTQIFCATQAADTSAKAFADLVWYRKSGQKVKPPTRNTLCFIQ